MRDHMLGFPPAMLALNDLPDAPAAKVYKPTPVPVRRSDIQEWRDRKTDKEMTVALETARLAAKGMAKELPRIPVEGASIKTGRNFHFSDLKGDNLFRHLPNLPSFLKDLREFLPLAGRGYSFKLDPIRFAVLKELGVAALFGRVPSNESWSGPVPVGTFHPYYFERYEFRLAAPNSRLMDWFERRLAEAQLGSLRDPGDPRTAEEWSAAMDAARNRANASAASKPFVPQLTGNFNVVNVDPGSPFIRDH